MMKKTLDPERLVSCREEKGMTQTEAAQRIGVTQPAYQRYEAGSRTPSIQVIKEMAVVFGTSADYLMGESDERAADSVIVKRAEAPILYSLILQCQNCSDSQLQRLSAYLERLKK